MIRQLKVLPLDPSLEQTEKITRSSDDTKRGLFRGRNFPQPKKNLHQRVLQHAKKGGPLWAAEKNTTKI
jgi:hypothetical protein